jgi:hypothetical protein
MQTVTRFIADDGTMFDTFDNCADYENMCAKVKEVMLFLEPVPDETDFCNGSGYIQQSEKNYFTVKNCLLDIIATKIKHPWVEETKTLNRHPSHIGRLLDDSNIKCLYQSWNRLMRIDSNFREWGQQYFAIHGGENKRLN